MGLIPERHSSSQPHPFPIPSPSFTASLPPLSPNSYLLYSIGARGDPDFPEERGIVPRGSRDREGYDVGSKVW